MKIYEFALKMRDLASSKVEKLNKLAGNTRSKVEQLGAQASKAAGKLQQRFPAASQAVAAVGNAASRVTRKMGKLRQVVASGVIAAFKGLKKALLAIGVAATLAFGVAVKESMGFNAQMSRVQAVTGAAGADMQIMRKKAMEMGKSTKFSAKEAGEGLEELTRAGFTAKDSASALGGVLDLAAASGVSLGKAAKTTSGIVNGFGFEAGKATYVADILAKTASSSATDIEGLTESFTYLMSTAKPLGITLEESAAAIGILGDGTLTGSMATTTLASGLSRLAKPTRQMRTLMKGLGIEMFDSKGKFIGLASMTQELERVTANMTDRQKQATLSTLFGANALKNFSTLLDTRKKIQIDATNATQVALMKRLIGEKRLQAALKNGGETVLKGAEALKAYNLILATSEGTAKKMAKTMEDNLAGDVTKAKSAFSGLMIEIGDRFDPFLRRMTQSMTGVLSNLGENFGTYYKTLSDAFAPLRKAFGQFKRDLLGAQGSLGDFGNASLGVKEVVQGIAQAVSFVSPFIATMLTNISGLINRLATTFAPMKDRLQQLLGGLRTNLLMVSQDVWNIAGNLIGALSPLIEVVLNVANTIMDNFGHIWKAITGVVNMVLPFVYQLADSFRANVDVGGLLDSVMRGVTAVINGLRPVLRVILRLLTPLGKLFLWIGGILLKVVGVAFEGLGTTVGKVFGGIGDLFNWLIDKFSWVFNKIKQGLRLIGVMSKEADSVSQKQKDKIQQDKKPKPKTIAEEQQEKEEKERKKRVQKLQDEIDRFNEDRKKKTVDTMTGAAFNTLIAPAKKPGHPKVNPTGGSNEIATTSASGMNKITGGGSKQVNININVGAINGIANIENVNSLDSKGQEVQQSADFIVQEIVRKINGAMMVQEG
ncbi:phage tail tape measure protein [Microscilla marina]|uniref:Phage tail tape measure protein, family, core region n=1 Tax=Microscilla marina ATCC 23134 TaxID=313606 RepID=A1ZMF8_MICM2|nr:phage tail tape measure protein [Microscilla marina]EAY28338.1 phage tail tape measure protein, family, core region [Microscilla marina ATCC 23134]